MYKVVCKNCGKENSLATGACGCHGCQGKALLENSCSFCGKPFVNKPLHFAHQAYGLAREFEEQGKDG